MTYRIKLVKGNDEFEVEGDKKFVLELFAKHGGASASPVLAGETASRPSKARPVPVLPIVAGKRASAGEFIRQTGFKKHTDMVLAFGYYLEKFSGLSSFTPADINACYYEAKLESSNTSQMIIQNIRSGRMMNAPKAAGKARKAYVLTHTGEEFIEKKVAKPAK